MRAPNVRLQAIERGVPDRGRPAHAGFRLCTRYRFAAALLLIGAAGCGQRVDLGGPSSDPPATDLDGGPPTTLYQFHEGLDGCAGVAVDDEYLYVSTRDTEGSSVHRCRKANCAATLTRMAGPFCDLCV